MVSPVFLYFCNDKLCVLDMKYLLRLLTILCFLAFAWDASHYIKEKTTKYEHRTVLCIPVYGHLLGLINRHCIRTRFYVLFPCFLQICGFLDRKQ